MRFFHGFQSFLRALLVCLYARVLVFRRDVDVDTKHSTGVGEGRGFIKLFPSAPLYSPVGVMRRDGRGITASIRVELGAEILVGEMQ